MLTKIKNYFYLISPIIILAGCFLRLIVYLQNRSLTIDEANLTIHIVERDFVAFFESLKNQYCPPIFLVLSKLSTMLFGVNEYALKLIPLITGMVTLVLSYLLIKKIVKERLVEWYLLAMLSFSVLAIRYGTEVKQYASDAALTLFLIYIALQLKEKEWSVKNSLLWGIIGCFSIWLSMPSIFVLAAIGFAFLQHSWTVSRKIPIGLIAVGASWLLSFGVYFFAILYQDSTPEVLQDYHRNFFFNFLPTSFTELSLDANLIVGIMTSVTDRTAVSFIFGLTMLVWGSVVIIKRDKFVALLLLLPVLFAFIASNLKLYSLIPRLSLFFIPILTLLLGVGLATVWKKSTTIIKVGLVTLMLISIVNKEGYIYFWTKLELEDSKSCLAYLADKQKNDELIFVQIDATAAFYFYNILHDNAYNLEPVHLAAWNEKTATTIPELNKDYTKFWLFFAHTFPEDKVTHLASAKTIGKEVNAYESVTASVYGFVRE